MDKLLDVILSSILILRQIYMLWNAFQVNHIGILLRTGRNSFVNKIKNFLRDVVLFLQ